MTDELISRKSLLNEIDEVIAQYNWKDDGIIMDTLDNVRDMIFDHPTAYDTDKVIEQLADEAVNMVEFFTDDYRDDYYRGANVAYCNAIEIVKRGGVEE